MRLLKTKSNPLEFEEFEKQNVPLYAILSHTWNSDEVSFQDIQRTDASESGKDYRKVTMTCSVAAAYGLDYVWIDTCCIDKTSSAELSEAINSMYRWYEESSVCFAYLEDVPPSSLTARLFNFSLGDDQSMSTLKDEFAKSRWFTRGWTLQELIAPSVVIFFNQTWDAIGTKSGLQHTISEITGIPVKILDGADLENASIAQRMSWASKRRTTRPEDVAYCLLGIFGINMPMLYGEGEKAFLRLQEEIMRVSDDHSLLAWGTFRHSTLPWDNTLSSRYCSLLATSPMAFAESGGVVPLASYSITASDITLNNKGIHLSVRLGCSRAKDPKDLAFFPCTIEEQKSSVVGIYLENLSEAKDLFVRMDPRLVTLDREVLEEGQYLERRICVRRERQIRGNCVPLARAVEEGDVIVAMMLLQNGAKPDVQSLWQASTSGYDRVVMLLLEKGSLPDSESLLRAASGGHKEVVRLLLERGVQPDPLSLWQASENGHEEVVRLLLHWGAEPDSESLSRAASNGHEAVVERLLAAGAKQTSRPIRQAVDNGHKAVAGRLLRERFLS